jgi:quercetin dioxygenase-like cupin family protein
MEPVLLRMRDRAALGARDESAESVNAQSACRAPVQGFVRSAGDAQAVDAPAGRVACTARSTETGGAMTCFETVAAPGEGPPHHVHVSEDEFIYVLDGRLRVRLAETIHEALAGAFVFIPKGLPHTWQVVDAVHARFVFAFAPAAPGMEWFFERSAELEAKTRLADAFGRFAVDAGMRVVGPPLAHSHPLAPVAGE